MIACAGYHRYLRGDRQGADPLSLDASASLSIPTA